MTSTNQHARVGDEAMKGSDAHFRNVVQTRGPKMAASFVSVIPLIPERSDCARGLPVYIQDFSDLLVPEFQAIEAPPERTDAEPLTQFQRHGSLDLEHDQEARVFEAQHLGAVEQRRPATLLSKQLER